MTKVIQLHKVENSESVKAQVQAQDVVYIERESLALKNRQLSKDLTALKERLEFQANLNHELKVDVKEVKAENEILLSALEDDYDPVPLLTTPTQPGSMNGYWEQEYLLLGEKIRVMEQTLLAKDKELQAERNQNELLLNELLIKK